MTLRDGKVKLLNRLLDDAERHKCFFDGRENKDLAETIKVPMGMHIHSINLFIHL